MKFFLFAALAMLTLSLSNCNRAPAPDANSGSASAPAPKTQAEEQKKSDNFSIVDNFVEEAVQRIEGRVDITDEQKETIRKMGLEYDFAGADVAGRRELVKKMLDRVKKEVLTKEQRKKATKRG